MATKSKNGVAGWCFTLAIGFCCVLYLVWGSYFFERTATFSEGMATCFERLRTSYTSSLLGRKDFSLNSSFFKNTETCFSEVVFFMEKNFYASLVKGLAPINNLVADIHWFQKNLKNGKNEAFQRSQFGKLEDAHKGIVNRLQSERKRHGYHIGWARNLFFVLTGMSLLFFLLTRLTNRKKNSALLAKNTDVVHSDWEKIFLSESLGGTLDSLVNRILVQGIRVELDMEEDFHIYARRPSLKKALDVLLCHVLDSFEGEGQLSISQKYSKNYSILTVTPFEEKAFQEGERQVFERLVRESGGRIEEISSGQIKISFMKIFQGRTVKATRRLLKGKKKDVLRQLSSWENE